MEFIRSGKRLKGAFVQTSKSLIYCAFKSPKDIFLDGRPGEIKSIADGWEDGRAAWSIDEDMLRTCQRRGVKYIAVFVRKMKWYFIVEIEAFFDRTRFFRRSRKGTSRDERHVPIKYWTQRHGQVNLGPTSKF